MYRNEETLKKLYKKAIIAEIYDEIVEKVSLGLKEEKDFDEFTNLSANKSLHKANA